MAKSLAQIEKQIAKLRGEAQALKAREAAGVIEKIRVAIDHYGLTVHDLFGSKAGRPPATKAAGAPAKRRKARKASVVKFRDDAGHTWTGHGKRPNWFKEALAGGKTPEDLLAKP